MNTGRLSDFIQAKRDAGTVESAGSFTLAIEKARDKLATYSFARPEDYIIKLVQCAVNLGVDELFFELHRKAVVFWFEVESGNRDLSVDRLSDALLSPIEETHKGRSHLSLALCAIAAERPAELMWGEWGPEESLILSLGHDRSELFRDPPFPRVQPLEQERRFHLLYFQKQPSTLPVSQTSEENAVLRQRCCFAPLTLHLNGRELGATLPPSGAPTDLLRNVSGLYLGGFRLETEPPLSFHWPRSRPCKASIPDRLQPICADLPPTLILDLPAGHSDLLGPFEFSAFYGVEAYLYGPSRIHYLKEGVLMDAVTGHTAGGGAFAVLDGSELKTDLTGLKVVRGEKVERDVEEATLVWKTLINRYLEAEPPLFPTVLTASREEAIKKFLPASLYFGGVKPLLNFLGSSRRNSAKELEKFHHTLEMRRTYIEYFR